MIRGDILPALGNKGRSDRTDPSATERSDRFPAKYFRISEATKRRVFVTSVDLPQPFARQKQYSPGIKIGEISRSSRGMKRFVDYMTESRRKKSGLFRQKSGHQNDKSAIFVDQPQNETDNSPAVCAATFCISIRVISSPFGNDAGDDAIRAGYNVPSVISPLCQ